MPPFASAALLLLASAAPFPEAPPEWLKDLDQAKRLAREAGKPIFVVFRCEH